jgi:hypothetical protein
VKAEITDVQRLTLKPGDRIVVRVPEKLDAATADHLYQRIRARLDIPGDVPLVILDGDMSVEVVEGL